MHSMRRGSLGWTGHKLGPTQLFLRGKNFWATSQRSFCAREIPMGPHRGGVGVLMVRYPPLGHSFRTSTPAFEFALALLLAARAGVEA